MEPIRAMRANPLQRNGISDEVVRPFGLGCGPVARLPLVSQGSTIAGAMAFPAAMFRHPSDGLVTTRAVSTSRPAILTGGMSTVSYGPACIASDRRARGTFLSLY